MRSYAIGDIHGRRDLLLAAHARIAHDRAQTRDGGAPVVHIGDYVDRGEDSPGVLDHLAAGVAQDEPWVLLKGNHDRMMWRFLQEPEQPEGRRWLEGNIGGRATLAAYGIEVGRDRPFEAIRADARAAVPQAHVDLLGGLENSYRRGGVFFCHAGIRPGVPLNDQTEDDLVWIRDRFLFDTRDHGALIVHGHTPVDRATHYGNRVNLDSGAAYGGPLSAVVIEAGEVFLLTAEGRVPVRPAR